MSSDLNPAQTWINAVVIAARNEADNIAEAVAAASHYGHVIVVDNASTDGTADIAGAAGAVVIRHRYDTHIKQSYLDGFRFALRKGAESIVQMDAGLSFDADDIPRLLRNLGCADLVIGSRFVRGAQCQQPMLRRALSRGGSWLVRLMTGMPYSDLTSGFKAYNASLLRELDNAEALTALRASAHGFQFELAYEIHRRNYIIQEVPVSYVSTRSSVNFAVIMEALRTVCRLALRRFTI